MEGIKEKTLLKKIQPYENFILPKPVVFLWYLISFIICFLDSYYMIKIEGIMLSSIFLTNWGQNLTTLFCFLSLVHILLNIKQGSRFNSFYGTFYNILLAAHFLIFVFYWPMLSKIDFLRCMSYTGKKERSYTFMNAVWRHLGA